MITGLVVGSMLCLIRVSAFIAFFPSPAGRTIPATVRIGLAFAITVCVAPLYAARFMPIVHTADGVGWLLLAILSAQELLYGAGLAWMLSLCLVPVRIAGAFVAQEMGLTLGGLTSPQDQQPSNVITGAFEAIAGIIFFSLNLHHIALGAIGTSFEKGPASGFSLMPTYQNLMNQVSRVQDGGLLIVAPIAIMLFLFLIALLVTVRSAPQFNFFTLGMPMRVGVGSIGLLLFLPQLTSSMAIYMRQIAYFGVF